MTYEAVLAVLHKHQLAAFNGSDTACACDRKWRSNADYRIHVADALTKPPDGPVR